MPEEKRTVSPQQLADAAGVNVHSIRKHMEVLRKTGSPWVRETEVTAKVKNAMQEMGITWDDVVAKKCGLGSPAAEAQKTEPAQKQPAPEAKAASPNESMFDVFTEEDFSPDKELPAPLFQHIPVLQFDTEAKTAGHVKPAEAPRSTKAETIDLACLPLEMLVAEILRRLPRAEVTLR